MKCHIPFSGKNKKNISKCRLLKFFPRMLGVKKKRSLNVRNVPSDMCVQIRFKSACASALSDQSIRCPHDEPLHPWLSKVVPVKIHHENMPI